MRRYRDELGFMMFLVSLGLVSACLLYLEAYEKGRLDGTIDVARKKVLDLVKERMADLIKKDQEAASD